MHFYKILFLTLRAEFGFRLSAKNKNNLSKIVNELLKIFIDIEDESNPSLNLLQQYDEEKKRLLKEFISKNSEEIPQLNGLQSYLKKINIGGYFLFIPNLEFEQVEILKFKDYLFHIENNVKYEGVSETFSNTYEVLLKKYIVNSVGDKRKNIGNRIKQNRICRFCRKSSNQTTFNNKAHAISEALGNKKIILFDECDECNKYFSQSIEVDIINLLSMFRTIFDIKGKNGSKKIEGKNFKLKYENGQVKLDYKNQLDLTSNTENFNLILESFEQINFQSIYKALCKYFLSVIDQELLVNFTDTIDWLRAEKSITELPKIAELTTYNHFTKEPILTYYIRRNSDYEIPFAFAEFRFTCKIFVFIIPLCKRDNKKFLNKKEYQNFWSNLKHYQKYKSWIFNDYSDNIKKDFSINLNLNFSDNEL